MKKSGPAQRADRDVLGDLTRDAVRTPPCFFILHSSFFIRHFGVSVAEAYFGAGPFSFAFAARTVAFLIATGFIA